MSDFHYSTPVYKARAVRERSAAVSRLDSSKFPLDRITVLLLDDNVLVLNAMTM
jgi:hypothetical protein